MALGDILQQETQPQIRNALAQAMAPKQVASGGQGGIGALLQSIQQNPAAIQMLLATGAKLLNPTSFQRPGGRIADAVSTGVSGYNELQSQAEEKEFRRDLLEGREDREDRKVDLTEDQMEVESEQWAKEFGLSKKKLNEQKKLWAAQAAQYRSNAKALQEKAARGVDDDLTGPERQTNKLASILNANGVPEDRAYVMAFDIYNKAGESEAKAIASTYEMLGFLADTEEGAAQLDRIVQGIKESFSTGTEVLENVQQGQGQPQGGPQAQEVAPGVTQTDVQAALAAINQNSGTELTWDQLNDMQKNRLIEAIQKRKGGQ